MKKASQTPKKTPITPIQKGNGNEIPSTEPLSPKENLLLGASLYLVSAAYEIMKTARDPDFKQKHVLYKLAQRGIYRITRKRARGWKKPENTVYVGRGSQWGNPFILGNDGDVKEVMAKYRNYLMPYSHKTGTLEDFFLTTSNIEHIRSNLAGKNLMCWCKEGACCHADVLLYIANSEDFNLEYTGTDI